MNKHKTKDTIIISDLHLTVFEKSKGLWRKYAQPEQAPDKSLVDCFNQLISNHPDRTFEFVFNGDIFDFDNVHLVPKKHENSLRIEWVQKKMKTTEKNSVQKIRCILEERYKLFEELGAMVAKGHDIVFVRGNHDVEIIWKGVQEEIRKTITDAASKAIGKGRILKKEEKEEQIRFYDWFYYKKEHFYIEHGNQYEAGTMSPFVLHPFIRGDKEAELSYVSYGARIVANRLGFHNPYVLYNLIASGVGHFKRYKDYIIPNGKDFFKTWMIGGIQTIRALSRMPYLLQWKERKQNKDKRTALAKRLGLNKKVLKEIELLWPSPVLYAYRSMVSLIQLDKILSMTIVLWTLLIYAAINIFFNFAYDTTILMILIALTGLIMLWLNNTRVPETPKYVEIARILSRLVSVPTVIFGHTHEAGRIDVEGEVRYLNPGTWAPAFYDVECEQPLEYMQSFVWIHKNEGRLFHWRKDHWKESHQGPRDVLDAKIN